MWHSALLSQPRLDYYHVLSHRFHVSMIILLQISCPYFQHYWFIADRDSWDIPTLHLHQIIDGSIGWLARSTGINRPVPRNERVSQRAYGRHLPINRLFALNMTIFPMTKSEKYSRYRVFINSSDSRKVSEARPTELPSSSASSKLWCFEMIGLMERNGFFKRGTLGSLVSKVPS